MKLDLAELKRMHPLLPASTATEYAHRAGVGFERHGHSTGVSMATRLDAEHRNASVHWVRPAVGDEDQLDRNQVTEDAAEAVALAVVHVARGWVVRRRLQRGDAADWLLQDAESTLVALEISGVGESEDPGRLARKLEQVRGAKIGQRRVACVVELFAPRTTLATA